MKFTVYQGSRKGPRPINQDRTAYSYSKEALLLVMADGMGGHSNGEVAAQLAVKMLAESFQTSAHPRLSSPNRFLNETISDIHAAIEDGRQLQGLLEAPRTTIVAAVIQDNKLYTAHVGDSRLYHFRNKQLIYRTVDHSVVQMLLRRGQIKAENLQAHPDRHKIYNCLGGDKAPQIELSGKRQLMDGDVLLLCTDGLWSVMSDSDITLSLHSGPVNQSATRLLDKAESLGKKDGDNVSLLAVQWGDPEQSDKAILTGTLPLEYVTTIMDIESEQANVIRQGIASDSNNELSEDEIDKAIADIQAALRKHS